ncbi:hypothetical protein HPB48_015642 [Haemaphysalis longicornis]|uniref:Uncharacterized protein n=1 Tax=Haemaphysalis longicornis TaxID=44386 RepID=A0A9J6GBD2_HAELO|nr:hypothetical protein HPB48_015642 [Haemaphysalis longicornis]
MFFGPVVTAYHVIAHHATVRRHVGLQQIRGRCRRLALRSGASGIKSGIGGDIWAAGAPPGGLQRTVVFCMGSRVLLRSAVISFLGPKRISRSSTARLRAPEDTISLPRECEFSQLTAVLNHGKLDLVPAGLGLTTGTTNAGYDRRRRDRPAVLPSTDAIVTRAQRRREGKPKPQGDDYKLVLRPQGGLKIAELDLAEVSLALLTQFSQPGAKPTCESAMTWCRTPLKFSTPSAEAAKALSQVKQIRINNMTYPVQLYGLAPDHSVKGIIRGAPLRFSERELLDNMYVPNHEI